MFSDAQSNSPVNEAINPLSANLTKWSNILKQFVGNSRCALPPLLSAGGGEVEPPVKFSKSGGEALNFFWGDCNFHIKN